MVSVIPYEEIDVEVRRLVRLMNALPGIRSVGSCAGHEPEAEAVVTFKAAELEAVARLARLLPFHGVRPRLVGGRPVVGAIVVTVRHCEELGLVHDLRLSASPDSFRWDLIGEVEANLANG